MPGDIETIKQRLDLVEVVNSYLTLKKAGRNWRALCPFHQERTPSFMVSQEKQIFKCFGCNEGGDVFNFLMKIENLNFKEALNLLADRAGVVLEKPALPRQAQVENDRKTRLYQINKLASDYFHAVLTRTKIGQPALQYLKKRGLSSAGIAKFSLGFAPADPSQLLSIMHRRGFTNQELIAAGSPDRFRNRIIFPLQDPMGQPIAFTGRALDESKGPKYLNTPETILFHKSRLLFGLYQAKNELRQKKYTIIVEGQMDVIASHEAKVYNVVASSGTALTGEQLMTLHRFSPNVILAMDNDSAGQRATRQAIELSLDAQLVPKVVVFPQGVKDVGEAVNQSPRLWRQLVVGAQPWLNWLIGQAIQSPLEELTARQKRTIAESVLPFIKRITNPIEQTHWLQTLGKRLAVNESILRSSIKATARHPPTGPLTAVIKSPAKTADSLSSLQRLYGLLTLNPAIRQKYDRLYNRLEVIYNERKSSIVDAVAMLYEPRSESERHHEIAMLIERLRAKKQEKIKTSFAAQIADAEERHDRQAVKKLLQELQRQLTKPT